MTSVVVGGALAAKPGNGGEAWVRLSYVLGLRRLGIDATLLEQVDRASRSGIAWFRRVTRRFDVAGALVDGEGRQLVGVVPERADAMLNLSGNVRLPLLLRRFRRRAFVDLDPGFTQSWLRDSAISAGGHHVHFTVGTNVGRHGCSIPTAGIRWRPTLPPVLVDEWPAEMERRFDRFTTVATWRPGHGPVAIGGRLCGLRVHAFRRLLDLPRRTALPFEAALAIAPEETRDLAGLSEGGWRLVDPAAVAGDPDGFRAYVSGSGAELGVSQEAYTATGSGWLSDRTARYLAAGRPALVDHTGQRTLPAGDGLLVYRTPAEAGVLARELVRDYDRHAQAARALACEHLDSDIVLGRLLEDLL